jgi:hypothetical protein
MSHPPAPARAEEANQSSNSSQNSVPKTPSRRVWGTATLVAAWIVTVNAWTTRHLGWGLESVFGLASIATGLALAFSVLGKVLPEDEWKNLRISAAKVPLTLVLGAWIAFCAIASVRSSVLIVRDATGDTLSSKDLLLTSVSSGGRFSPDAQDPKAEPVRFRVPTTPFGRAYRLKVPGYLEQVVQVFPLTGLTVIPERDLRVSPSVLFRPSITAIRELGPSGGKFQVLTVTGTAKESLAVSCQKSSLLLGSAQEIPASWPGLWKLELDTHTVPGGSDQSNTAETMLAWLQHTYRRPPHDLAPGTELEARVISSGNAIVASARTTLRSEPLIDVALQPLTSTKILTPQEVPPCPKD